MKKLLSILFVSSCLLGYGQNLETVLKKHYKAMGSKKWEKVKTIHAKMEMTMMGIDMTMDISLKKPDKMYAEMTMSGQDIKMIMNGNDGVMFIGDQIVPMDEEQKKSMSGQINLEGDLYNYEEKGHKVSLKEKKEIDGKEYYILDVIMKDKEYATVLVFLDAETYIMEKMELEVTEDGVVQHMTMIPDDISEVDGIKIIKKLTTETGGVNIMELKLSDIKFNIPLDDELFNIN